MKIALRNKPTKKQGKSLYLDFYDNGRRWYEFLNLFLTGDLAIAVYSAQASHSTSS